MTVRFFVFFTDMYLRITYILCSHKWIDLNTSKDCDLSRVICARRSFSFYFSPQRAFLSQSITTCAKVTSRL